MPGYREHSFDPYAYEQPGAPVRPFNWVQWLGAGLIAIGLAAFLVYAASRLGWIPAVLKNPAPVTGFSVIGIVLINSRRQPGTPAGSEQLQRNRKVLLITVAILAVILGAAIVIDSLGA